MKYRKNVTRHSSGLNNAQTERVARFNRATPARFAILGGVLIVGLLLSACPVTNNSSGADNDGDSNGGGNGNGSEGTKYVCENGTPVDGDATADNITKCQRCKSGFKLTAAHTCVTHAYVCNNGTPSGEDATADNITKCQSCHAGYKIYAQMCVRIDIDGDGILNAADSCPRGQNNWTSTSTTDMDGDGCRDSDEDVDDNNNGLIEIATLTMLHNMRYNLVGTGYDDEALDSGGGDATGDNRGGPTSATTDCTSATSGVYLCGYELTQSLTFDTASNGTFTESNGTYTLDSNDNNDTYFPVSSGAGGWLPIGDKTNPFVAIFEGNGHTITGLAIKRTQAYVGMFGYIGTGAHIRNVGLVNNLADYSGSDNSGIYIGGLVGTQDGGFITASYATGSASGSAGNADYTGGLVGHKLNGSITASYTTGSVNGGDGNNDYIGGLVGWQENGSITASYTTGEVSSGGGTYNNTGGLVGIKVGGSITASYTTGNINGGDGNNDRTGGLVGRHDRGSITASYATGSISGGAGTDDSVGKIIGFNNSGSYTATYGFGAESGGENDGIDASTLPYNITTVVALTAANLTGCVGIANEKAYTNSTTCTATSIVANACAWSSGTCSDGSNVVDGITCSAFTTQSTCPVSAISNKPAGTWNGNVWNAAGTGTAGAWDFGTTMQAPALRYSDYDGSGNDYNCNQFPSNVTCGTTLLPGQRN